MGVSKKSDRSSVEMARTKAKMAAVTEMKFELAQCLKTMTLRAARKFLTGIMCQNANVVGTDAGERDAIRCTIELVDRIASQHGLTGKYEASYYEQVEELCSDGITAISKMTRGW